MKHLLFYLTFIFWHITSQGQSIFQGAYGDSKADFGFSVVESMNNGYTILSLNRNISGIADSHIVIYNVDDNGGVVWSVKIGTNRNDYPVDIIQTSDGGYAVTGYTYGGLIDTNTTDIFLLKTDDQGNPIFFKTFGGPDHEQAHKILNSADGGFYIVGNTNGFGNGLTSALLIRTDNNGNQLWAKAIGTLDYTNFWSACLNHKGQILAGGTTYSTMNSIDDDFISLIDTNGNILWSKKIGSPSYDILNQIVGLSDGNFIIAGTSSNLTAGGYDYNICKLDSAGTIIWNKNYGTSLADYAQSISECSNGDLVITGQTNTTNPANPIYQTLIVRIDSNGNLIWSNMYGDPSNHSMGVKIINGPNDTIISVGYFSSLSNINGDTHLIKTDSNGNSGCFQQPLSLQTNNNTFSTSSVYNSQSIVLTDFMLSPNQSSFSCQLSLFCNNNSINQISINDSLIVYPNPGTGVFTFETGISGDHLLEIYDAIGKKIFVKHFDQKSFDVDLTNHLPGAYYLKLDNSQIRKLILTEN